MGATGPTTMEDATRGRYEMDKTVGDIRTFAGGESLSLMENRNAERAKFSIRSSFKKVLARVFYSVTSHVFSRRVFIQTRASCVVRPCLAVYAAREYAADTVDINSYLHRYARPHVSSGPSPRGFMVRARADRLVRLLHDDSGAR